MFVGIRRRGEVKRKGEEETEIARDEVDGHTSRGMMDWCRRRENVSTK